ncbi:Lipoprotein [Prescottella defluvii]|uniref:hypothetical protein n=1 Tax=Prescottella defluvii TaxID=1323361 RepID=UPI000B14320A|nr:hypothetical protein [Prescottella defluvii]
MFLLLAAAVSACGSDDADMSAPEPAVSETAASGDGASGASGSDVMARFTSCDDVAPAVAQYNEGLQESASNMVSEYGVICGWETPDGATDLGQIRTVEVVVEPWSGEVSAAGDLGAGGLVVVPDAGLEQAGGIAYTLNLSTSVAGVIVTTVETPDAKVTISGGKWDDVPALDGPAAVSVAKQLIGL